MRSNASIATLTHKTWLPTRKGEYIFERRRTSRGAGAKMAAGIAPHAKSQPTRYMKQPTAGEASTETEIPNADAPLYALSILAAMMQKSKHNVISTTTAIERTFISHANGPPNDASQNRDAARSTKHELERFHRKNGGLADQVDDSEGNGRERSKDGEDDERSSRFMSPLYRQGHQ